VTFSAASKGQVRLSDVVPPAEVVDGERKTVTALFADIKGSMELMEDLDPEEARAIVDPALRLMMDAVHHYGGFVVQSTGDGIFAVFGAPVAHEDHPQRALYSALRMHEAMRAYGERLRAEKGLNLQVRIGVNIGEVVVRTIQTGTEHAEYSPIGHSTSLAARLQTLATPGSTVISGHMRALVEGYFQLKGLGPARVKGVSEPVELFEVTGLGPLRTRLQRAAGRGLTKFVGRQREMEALSHTAEQAQTGHGQIVAVMAEPGVGKSRLFYEFKATSQSGWMVLEAFSVSYGKASVYLPVLELLAAYFEINRDDDDRKRRERVLGKVLGLDRGLEDTLPYMCSLLGIGDTADSLAQMDPQVRRRRTLDAIKRILLRESINQPLMIIFEDLHWIDSETQGLLNLLVDAITNARILLLVNYRPEYRHEWGSRTHYTQLRLDPLGAESAEEMLATLLGDEKELTPLKRLLIERTQGTPFFMEEMVQTLLEEGVIQHNGSVKLAQPISAIKVPPTVQAVLASRIDRLTAAEKELLQTLAVLGHEFSLALAQSVTSKPNDELESMLAQLQLGEFIHEQPSLAEVGYSFKHALTQEVAYRSVLAERRRALHKRAARGLEELYAQQLNDHYSDLAHHYLLSDDPAKAIQYSQFAAQQAVSRGVYVDATGLIKAALEMVDKLPEHSALSAELALRNVEVVIAHVMYGAASSEREHAIRRVCELGERAGDADQLLRGLLFLAQLYFVRGRVVEGAELAKRCIELAGPRGDAGLLADAHTRCGAVAYLSGKLREAILHFDRATVSSTASDRKLSLVGFPYSSTIGSTHALALQLLGYIGEAAKIAEAAVRSARDSRHLFGLGLMLSWSLGTLRAYRREPERALLEAEETIALSEENGFKDWLDLGRFNHGWALAELGQPERGAAEMELGLAGFRRARISLGRRFALALLAQNYARMRRSEEALQMLNDALAHAKRAGDLVDQPEMLRLKGEVLLITDSSARVQAEGCFRTALELARAQEAKWWELRASVSLARLLRDTNRGDEALTILAGIYNWFTEGFELPDLKDARTLLEELGT
jgi:class 3 adenylate cyclase/tetratricopeptide (TPR) repeat protein